MSTTEKKNKSWDTDSVDFNEALRLKEQAVSYAESSSLHGIKYIAERDRWKIERILWSILFIGSVVLCAILIKPIYDKWKNSPTLVTISDTTYPIWNIHFPAVTICSNNKVVKRQLNAALKKCPWNDTALVERYQFKYDDRAEEMIKEDVKSVLKKYVFFAEDKSIVDNITDDEAFIIDNYGKFIPTLLQQVMMKCSDMVLMCLWQGNAVACPELFTVRRTDSGFCCSFNSVNIDEQFETIDADVVFDDGSDDYDYYFDYNYYDNSYPWNSYYYYNDYNFPDFYGNYDSSYYGSTGETTSTSSAGLAATDFSSTVVTTDTGTNTQTTSTNDFGTSSVPTEYSTGSGTNTGTTATNAETTEAGTSTYSIRRKRSVESTTTVKPAEVMEYCSNITSQQIQSRNSTVKDKPAKQPTKLKRSNSASTLLGLTIMIFPDPDQYEVAMNNYYGFRVLVHSPFAFPEVTGRGFAVGRGRESFLGVTASTTESTEAVRRMELKQRKCIFHDEQDLHSIGVEMKVFQNYSRESCLLECKAETLRKHCGCLPYYFPDFSTVWQENTSCNRTQLQCLANWTASLSALDPSSKDNSDEEIDSNELIKGAHCNCPNDCDGTVYFQEMSQADMHHDSLIYSRLQTSNNSAYYKVLKEVEALEKALEQHMNKSCEEAKDKALKDYFEDFDFELNQIELTESYNESIRSEVNCTSEESKFQKSFPNRTQMRQRLEWLEAVRANSTLVHIYFKELGIVKYSRDELYGTMDVIGAFGGIVGLCMGFSLLSALELIYYFTLRYFVDLKKEGIFRK